MHSKPICGLFITGTDTDVGKTYVTCQILRSLRHQQRNVGAYKPACSGAISLPTTTTPAWNDVEELWQATGSQFPKERICPQTFLAPLAPPLAARNEGRTVSAQLLREGIQWWQSQVDYLAVEGAGGLFAPISDEEVVLDLSADLGFPALIVARPTLGTINHTLLSIAALRHRRIPLAGVIFSSSTPFSLTDAADNARLIEQFSGVPMLAMLGPGENLPPEFLAHSFFQPAFAGESVA